MNHEETKEIFYGSTRIFRDRGNLYGNAKVTAALNTFALSQQLLSNGSNVLTAIIGNISYPLPTPSPLLNKKIRPPTKPQTTRFFQGLMETLANGINRILGW